MSAKLGREKGPGMPKAFARLLIEKHGDITRLLDEHGHTRGLLFLLPDTPVYCLVGPIGTTAGITERRGTNKRNLIKSLREELGADGYY